MNELMNKYLPYTKEPLHPVKDPRADASVLITEAFEDDYPCRARNHYCPDFAAASAHPETKPRRDDFKVNPKPRAAVRWENGRCILQVIRPSRNTFKGQRGWNFIDLT